MKGFCECGCGQKTNIATKTFTKWGHIKGEPVRFVRGHQNSINKYRGGKAKHSSGYEMIMAKGHPRADKRGYIPKSVWIVEQILGKQLPLGAIIHHVDSDKTNDAKINYVVCQDKSYNNLLHRRERALKACGHASWRKCKICKNYDDPANLVIGKRTKNGSQSIYHSECRNLKRRKNR